MENYQKRMEETLAALGEQRPTLLLHSCCAPCSSAVLEVLTPHFSVTVDYFNPNIFPEEEYTRRAQEEQCFVREVYGDTIPVRSAVWEPEAFARAVAGLENIPEGGERCFACYGLRMEHTARTAAAEGFSFFTSTLSVSPHKNAQKLNEIGLALEAQYGVHFLCADFKKKNGFKRSGALSAQYGLYRQDYCGCRYSRAEQELRRLGLRRATGEPPVQITEYLALSGAYQECFQEPAERCTVFPFAEVSSSEFLILLRACVANHTPLSRKALAFLPR